MLVIFLSRADAVVAGHTAVFSLHWWTWTHHNDWTFAACHSHSFPISAWISVSLWSSASRSLFLNDRFALNILPVSFSLRSNFSFIEKHVPSSVRQRVPEVLKGVFFVHHIKNTTFQGFKCSIVRQLDSQSRHSYWQTFFLEHWRLELQWPKIFYDHQFVPDQIKSSSERWSRALAGD